MKSVALSATCVVAVDLLIRLMAVWRTGKYHPGPTNFVNRRRRWRWFAFPASLMIIASPLFYNWPLKLRFELSRSALEKEAARLRCSPRKSVGPRWVGLYNVISYEPIDDDWQYFVEGAPGQSGHTWFFTGNMSWGLVSQIRFSPGVLMHHRPASVSPPDDRFWGDLRRPEMASPPWYVYDFRP